jgi:hypothetical protein
MKMKKSICLKMLLATVCVLGCSAFAQTGVSAKRELSGVELTVTYDSMLANVTTGNEFWMNGGSVQGQVRVWGGLCAAADFAGLHAGNVSAFGYDLDLLTVTFGPRYVWSPSPRRIWFFGHGMAGLAHGMNGLFPTSTALDTTANSLAVQIGGGVNLPLGRHLLVRAIDANWLRTQLPNATTNVQNNLRLGAGVGFRF